MMSIVSLIASNWRLVLVGVLIAFASLQSYRLRGALGDIKVYKEREAAQLREQQGRALANLRNKERADEDFNAGRTRADNVVVREKSAAVITVRVRTPAAGSSAGAAACYGGRELDDELAAIARRHAEGSNRVLGELAALHRAGAERVAREGEIVAAAFRSCRTYALNIQAGLLPRSLFSELGN